MKRSKELLGGKGISMKHVVPLLLLATLLSASPIVQAQDSSAAPAAPALTGYSMVWRDGTFKGPAGWTIDKVRTGLYQIRDGTANEDLRPCAAVMTPQLNPTAGNGPATQGRVYVQYTLGNSFIAVFLYDKVGNPTDSAFSLVAAC